MMTMPRANVPSTLTDDAAELGATGNERLTAWAGAALFVGFGLQGITILNMHSWLTAHMLIGISLFIPVGIKIASTGYRFVRYYTNSPAYVRKGPPHIVLRVLAPFLLLNTALVMCSGALIPLSGSYRHSVETLHKLSFATWLVLFGIHVLAYLRRMPQLLTADLMARGTTRSTATQRIVIVAGGGVAGIALALVAMPWVRAWITP
jgi:hypothetical protein